MQTAGITLMPQAYRAQLVQVVILSLDMELALRLATCRAQAKRPASRLLLNFPLPQWNSRFWSAKFVPALQMSSLPKRFSRASSQKRHMETSYIGQNLHECPFPSSVKGFTRADNLTRHLSRTRNKTAAFAPPKYGTGTLGITGTSRDTSIRKVFWLNHGRGHSRM